MTLHRSLWKVAAVACCCGVCLFGVGHWQLASAAEEETAAPWSERDTKLATDYLGMLLEQPDDSRVLDLLWSLYEKHGQTDFLLESIAAQTQQQNHPQVILIHAHLLRKAGQIEKATARYKDVLALQPGDQAALRALIGLLKETGDTNAAADYLQQLTKLIPAGDPRRSTLLLEQSSLLLDLNKSEEAIKACDQAVAESPEDVAIIREASRIMLGAGMLDRSLILAYRLADKITDPTQKLDALFELSRLEEQADHFNEAAAVLWQGLDMLHYKDWRYAQFFQRQVKLHERYDRLDQLKAKLLKEAEQKPVTEKALDNLARFSAMIVDADERILWLRKLVQEFPQSLEYRWELVSVLIDHDDAQEAAGLLDEKLKQDGSDPVNLVLLRALAHLRLGDHNKADQILEKLLQVQGANPDVEKVVLNFARQKSLDHLVEIVLRARVSRQPDKAEPLFELASFLRSRGQGTDAEKLFSAYIAAASSQDKQRRMNEVASFLSGGNDLTSAEKAARAALAMPGAGRDELLRLTDVLVQRGLLAEAQILLERAWTMSDSEEKRMDVDERLASVLAGDQNTKLMTVAEPSAEFKLPAMFTGQGFGSEDPPAKEEALPESLSVYTAGQLIGVWTKLHPDLKPRLIHRFPIWLRPWVGKGFIAVNWQLPLVSDTRVLRAAWWNLRTGKNEIAVNLLERLLKQHGLLTQVPRLEVEKLLLEAYLMDRGNGNGNGNEAGRAIKQLRLLVAYDPANRTSYLLRLAELEGRRNGRAGLGEAVRILEELMKAEPMNEAILSALSQFYMESGRRDLALALWENAARKADGKAGLLLERYAELLIAQRRYDDFVATQVRLLDKEPDVKRRRDAFQRALERLLWTDSVQGELPPDEKKKRLESLKKILQERARRQPFDGFWHEALAFIYEREGDAVKAFAAMKQAYYTAPETPFSLEQLRVAAMRIGDVKSAIYFQKQIASTAAAKEQAGEWRQLVQLLESDFRMTEADRARQQLEARFSQDPTALEELARYYADTAQDDAARRVLEQLVRVRSWDAKSLFRLAMQQRLVGDSTAAVASLQKLLTTIPDPDLSPELAPERQPWPLLDDRYGNISTPSAILTLLENAPGLEQTERDRLRQFLSVPRGEFAQLPDDATQVRLRAVEELVKLMPSAATALSADAKLSGMEKAWAAYYSGEGDVFRQILKQQLGEIQNLESQFVWVWMSIKSRGMDTVITWCKDNGGNDVKRKQRKGLFQAVANILADDFSFRYQPEDIVALGNSKLLSNTELIDIARKLESRQQQALAITLTEAVRRNAPSLSADYALFLARLAESSGDAALEQKYMYEVWSKPLDASKANAFDSFMQSFSRLWQLAGSSAEREKILLDSWQRLSQLPESSQGKLRKARLLGIAGVSEPSVAKLEKFLGTEFLADRPFAEPVMGKLPPGAVPGPRLDELNHLRGYWEDLREWSELLRYDGLAAELTDVDAVIRQRNAGVPLGPRSNYEYTAWRNSALIRNLQQGGYAQRLQMLREFMEGDDSVESMLELGGFLESQGYARECIEIYRRLPDRAPSNTEYCEQLLRVCETSWECEIGIKFIEKLFVAEPQFKPQGISDETLREKHAKFIALLHDTGKLRMLAYRGHLSVKALQGRVPEEVPYLRELALLLERQGDDPGALAAWEELHRLWPEDVEASLYRARLLRQQGNSQRALEAIRKVQLNNFWSEYVREVFTLRAELVVELGLWDEMREMMNVVTGGPSPSGQIPRDSSSMVGAGMGSSRNSANTFTGGVLVLSGLLTKKDRIADAQSLLLRAERSVRDNSERFKLRQEQIRLSSLNSSWNPTTDQAAVAAWLRAENDDREAINGMVQFLSAEAGTNRASAWIEVLTRPSMPKNVMTALALTAFADRLQDQQVTQMIKPWQTAFVAFAAREIAVKTLLDRSKPALAREVALAGENKSVIRSAAYIPVLAAMNDQYGLEEIFSTLIRAGFPGGVDVTAYAEAFAKAGRRELADELYQLNLQRLRSTASSHPQLVESMARFLLTGHHYEQAETLLLREHHGMTDVLPPLLMELYRSWNKLDRITEELAKFHLSDGVYHEILYLVEEQKNPSSPDSTKPQG